MGKKKERSERHTDPVRMEADVPLLPSRVMAFTVQRFCAFVQRFIIRTRGEYPYADAEVCADCFLLKYEYTDSYSDSP